jgi:hypothetical protein
MSDFEKVKNAILLQHKRGKTEDEIVVELEQAGLSRSDASILVNNIIWKNRADENPVQYFLLGFFVACVIPMAFCFFLGFVKSFFHSIGYYGLGLNLVVLGKNVGGGLLGIGVGAFLSASKSTEMIAGGVIGLIIYYIWFLINVVFG